MGPQQSFVGTVRPRRLAALTTGTAYALARLSTLAVRAVSPRRHRVDRPTLLAIQSGERGWDLIEYQELLQSAREYLGDAAVRQLSVTDRRRYLRQTARSLRRGEVTHFFYDPRTGSQRHITGLLEALVLSWLLSWHGATPICWLADFPVRSWRLQCAVASAAGGATITFMDPEVVGAYFPHDRISGPSLMALSSRTLKELEELRAGTTPPAVPRVVFTGSLYEPRATLLREIAQGLSQHGRELEMLSRTLEGTRAPNEVYWLRLVESDILVTTSDHITAPGVDQLGVRHLLFRYTEALAASSLLVANEVPGADAYFVAGQHFVAFDTPAEAVERIMQYLGSPDARREIARRGHERVKELVESHAFWTAVDAAVGHTLRD